MNDMRAVIVPKSDQMNADDLIGGPVTITVESVAITPGKEQPVAIRYVGDNGKPYKPCKSMCKVMVHIWGADASEYTGRSMTLYGDPKVKWGGMEVGGIRISHMTHLAAPRAMALTETKGKKAVFVVNPLVIAAPKPDKASAVAEALIARVVAADEAGLTALTADAKVIEQRAWLAKNRPELAIRVDVAVGDALALFETVEDEDQGAEMMT
jgi:hypothetical protein